MCGMGSSEKISVLIDLAKRGDDDAATSLWEAYFPRLQYFAATRLRNNLDDADDVTLSVFKSFFLAAQDGRFPNLANRNDLWRLLSTMTKRKAIDLIRQRQSLKAGGGKVQTESALLGSSFADDGLNDFVDPRLREDLEVMFLEQVEHLLSLLDDKQQQIAISKLDGCTNKEIGEGLNVSHYSIERSLRSIRSRWVRVAPA